MKLLLTVDHTIAYFDQIDKIVLQLTIWVKITRAYANLTLFNELIKCSTYNKILNYVIFHTQPKVYGLDFYISFISLEN